MLQVTNELTQDPGLLGVGDASVLLLHDRRGEDVGPRPMVQRNLLQLALVDLRGVLARSRRDLVADRDERVEALRLGHVEVVLQLLAGQIVLAGLDLDQSRPDALAARHTDEPVGDDLLPAFHVERHFDEGLHLTCDGTHRSQQRTTEFLDDPHHRQKRRRRATFLFIGAGDP